MLTLAGALLAVTVTDPFARLSAQPAPLSAADQAARAKLRGWMENIKGGPRYEAVLVFNAQGDLMLAVYVPETTPPVTVDGPVLAAGSPFRAPRIFEQNPQGTWVPVQPQTPITHDCPDGHARPQAPQFVALVVVFTQAPPQITVGAVQTSAQTPATHDWPGRSEGLTERESEVVALITQGRSNKEIAELKARHADTWNLVFVVEVVDGMEDGFLIFEDPTRAVVALHAMGRFGEAFARAERVAALLPAVSLPNHTPTEAEGKRILALAGIPAVPERSIVRVSPGVLAIETALGTDYVASDPAGRVRLAEGGRILTGRFAVVSVQGGQTAWTFQEPSSP